MTTSPSLKKPLALPGKFNTRCSKKHFTAETVEQCSDNKSAILKGLLTHFHCKVDAHVNVFCPHVVGGLGVEDWEDPAVQVGLARRLGITGHSEDWSTGPVPGDQVGRPANTPKYS